MLKDLPMGLPEAPMKYVIDTNVLVDYPDIIPPLCGMTPPEEPTIDLSKGHIIIPTVVIRELSNFKKEKNERGKAARVILKRIRGIVEHSLFTMEEVYNLDAPVTLVEGGTALINFTGP